MEMRRPGRGPSSRAHVSSRGRRRMDGCRKAGTTLWETRHDLLGATPVLDADGSFY